MQEELDLESQPSFPHASGGRVIGEDKIGEKLGPDHLAMVWAFLSAATSDLLAT